MKKLVVGLGVLLGLSGVGLVCVAALSYLLMGLGELLGRFTWILPWGVIGLLALMIVLFAWSIGHDILEDR